MEFGTRVSTQWVMDILLFLIYIKYVDETVTLSREKRNDKYFLMTIKCSSHYEDRLDLNALGCKKREVNVKLVTRLKPLRL